MSSGWGVKRVVAPTNRRYSAAVIPIAALAHRCRAMCCHSRMHPLMFGIMTEPRARFAIIARRGVRPQEVRSAPRAFLGRLRQAPRAAARDDYGRSLRPPGG